MRIVSTAVLLFSLIIAPGAMASQTSAADIEHAAARYLENFAEEQKKLGRSVDYTLGSLDSRLQLAACDDDLTFEFVSEPEKSVRNTLLVDCSGYRPWRLFLNAEIKISAPAYVAATPLSRGTRITESMLRQEDVVINQSRTGVYHQPEGLIGMEVRRPVREGSLLSPSLLSTPEAVARGDRVKIEAQSGPIVIRTNGTAIAAGKIGEQIPVENERSGRQVRGVIIAPGHVRVVM